VTRTELETHLRFSAWATGRLLDAAAALPAEELRRDRGASHGGIEGTLAHVFQADRAWLSRLTENPHRMAMQDPGEVHDLPFLRGAWPDLHGKWLAWAGSAIPDDVIWYKNLAGREFQNPVWQIVLHVVNHATQHRGQVSAMLRMAGVAPPATDLIAFYRESAG
jgi:uncharacterized damage-inducible protein DinB